MCNLSEPYFIELDKIIREGVTEFCKENNISVDITLEYLMYKPLFLEYEITCLIPNLKKKYSALIIVVRDKDNIILLEEKKIPADCKKIVEMKDDIKNYIKEVLRNELELSKKILENEPALNELIENIKKLVKAKGLEGLDCELIDLQKTAIVGIPLCRDSIVVFISKADANINSIAVGFEDKDKSEIMAKLLKNFHHIHEPMKVDEYGVEIDVKNISRDRQLEILSKTIDALIVFHLI